MTSSATPQVVRVITVVPLDGKTREKAMAAARKLFGENITLEEVVDKDIVGGVILESEGRRYDASARVQLSVLRKALVQAGGAL